MDGGLLRVWVNMCAVFAILNVTVNSSTETLHLEVASFCACVVSGRGQADLCCRKTPHCHCLLPTGFPPQKLYSSHRGCSLPAKQQQQLRRKRLKACKETSLLHLFGFQ